MNNVTFTERRTKQDFAHCMKWLIDEVYPEVEIIRVVLDNLNTHTVAALYETFEAVEPIGWLIGWNFITRPNMAVG